MKTEKIKYSAPDMIVISLEPEQAVLAGSSIGSNEELLEDPSDYIDFFE